jgi:hypothetical protein
VPNGESPTDGAVVTLDTILILNVFEALFFVSASFVLPGIVPRLGVAVIVGVGIGSMFDAVKNIYLK